MKSSRWVGFAGALVIAGVLSPAQATASSIVFSTGGSTPGSIQTTVDNYRAALGSLNPNTGGAFLSGRREINWDGVPDNLSDPNFFQNDFFASTAVAGRARGLAVSTPGTATMVSSTAASGTPVGFGFPGDFIPFSPQRLFAPIGSTITDVAFFVPGTLTPATVSGFGSVFSDVELANVSSLQFFDVNNLSLGTFFVQTATVSGGLSFLGVQFDAGERIARVRITTGNSALLGNGLVGPGTDTVVMDDFIYAEPQAVPEPATLTLVGGAALIAIRRARKRRTVK
jgi:hypothetical protein